MGPINDFNAMGEFILFMKVVTYFFPLLKTVWWKKDMMPLMAFKRYKQIPSQF